MNKFKDVYNKIVKENTSYSVANDLYDLYVSLDPTAKTKSGALVSEVLKDIINELNDIVSSAERKQDLPETLPNLLRLLKFD
jgi:predicted Zn-dependent peptidase